MTTTELRCSVCGHELQKENVCLEPAYVSEGTIQDEVYADAYVCNKCERIEGGLGDGSTACLSPL